MWKWKCGVISLFLLLLCLSSCGDSKTAPEEGKTDPSACGENLTWTITEGGTLTISGTGEMYVWDYIGSTDNADTPWRNCDIKKVVVEEGVTSISNSSFAGYDLTELTLSDTVSSIGSYAFGWCNCLRDLTLGNGIKTIEAGAFASCDNLTCVTIGGHDVIIEEDAFISCENLTYVNIDSVSTVGEGAFAKCSQLQEVTLGGSVQSIGEKAFWDCDSLTRVTIDGSGMSIGFRAFYDCDTLNSVSLGTVSTVGDSAFEYCSNLVEVTFCSVTSIEDSAFYLCGALTDIYYGGSQAQWEDVQISKDNEALTAATVHFAQTD